MRATGTEYGGIRPNGFDPTLRETRKHSISRYKESERPEEKRGHEISTRIVQSSGRSDSCSAGPLCRGDRSFTTGQTDYQSGQGSRKRDSSPPRSTRQDRETRAGHSPASITLFSD